HASGRTLEHLERSACPGKRVLGLDRFAGVGVSERRVQLDEEICSQVLGCIVRLEVRDPVTELAQALGENVGQLAPSAEHQRFACGPSHRRSTLSDRSGWTVDPASGMTVRRAEWPPGHEAWISALSPFASAPARRSIVERTESPVESVTASGSNE